MTNEEIIVEAALAAGLYTQEQVVAIMEAGGELPLHTFAVWKEKGFVPKKGSKGLKVRLWRHRKKKGADNVSDSDTSNPFDPNAPDPEKGGYYMVTAALFDVSQVQKLEESA